LRVLNLPPNYNLTWVYPIVSPNFFNVWKIVHSHFPCIFSLSFLFTYHVVKDFEHLLDSHICMIKYSSPSILISNEDIHPPHIHMWNKNSIFLINFTHSLKWKKKTKTKGLNRVIKRLIFFSYLLYDHSLVCV